MRLLCLSPTVARKDASSVAVMSPIASTVVNTNPASSLGLVTTAPASTFSDTDAAGFYVYRASICVSTDTAADTSPLQLCHRWQHDVV